eukprot:1157400-Pelagomonas_calceolata.AAC.4
MELWHSCGRNVHICFTVRKSKGMANNQPSSQQFQTRWLVGLLSLRSVGGALASWLNREPRSDACSWTRI